MDLAIGGDHGKGLLQYDGNDKASTSVLLQVGDINCQKDTSDILKETIMDPIGESMKWIIMSGQFIVRRMNGRLDVTFQEEILIPESLDVKCKVPNFF